MVTVDEPTRIAEGDAVEPELPVQDQGAEAVVSDTAQALAADRLDAEVLQQGTGPLRVVG